MKKFENGLLSYNLQFFADEGEASEGVNETESAEQSEGEGEVTETENEGANEEVTEPQTQSPETNAAFANMRRQLEAANRRLADTDAMFARQFGKYTNPETGQPIRSAQDYYEAMAAQERMNAREQMQQNGIDPNMIDNLIANSPAVRQAQAATAELNNYRAQQKLEADYKEILALDPSLNGVEDILNDPSMPLMAERVAQGMSLVDAYKIVNFDKVFNSKEAAVKQQTINQVKGKNHLSTGAAVNVSSDLEDIPANMLEDFKDRFPEKSPKELKALYNQVLKAKKG
jgi:3-methyladenine DNA glycosylase/8-oxoguanine DNA glycosylase